MHREIWLAALILGLALDGVVFGQPKEKDLAPNVDQIVREDGIEQHTCAGESAIEGFAQALQGELGAEHLVMLAAMKRSASKCHDQGNFVRARELLDQIVLARRRMLGPEHVDTLNSMNSLIDMLNHLHEFQDAQRLGHKVLTISRKVLGDEHRSTLTTMNYLARTLTRLGDFQRAQEMQEQVLATEIRVRGAEHPSTLTTMNNLANTLSMRGYFQRAREMQEELLETQIRVQGAEHPHTLTMMVNLAGTLYKQGHFQRAREMQEQIIATQQRVLGNEHPYTLTTMHNLARTLRRLGDLQRAREMQEQVLATRRRVLGNEHPDTLTTIACLPEEQDSQRVREIENQILATQPRVPDAERPDTLTTMRYLARIRYRQRDFEGARKLFESALKIRRETYGSNDKQDFEMTHQLGHVYLELQDIDRAGEFFLQALDALETQADRAGDSPDRKINFRSRYAHYYRETLAVLVALGRTEDAHHVLERFRAYGLLAMLVEHDIIFEEIPPEVEERRRQLAFQYDNTIRHRDELDPKMQQAEFTAVLKRQQELHYERERLNAEIRRQAPKIADIQDPQPLTVDEIRHGLEPGTLLLSYMVGPDKTYLFTFSRDAEPVIHEIDVGEEILHLQIDRFLDQLEDSEQSSLGTSRNAMASWLYDNLIAYFEEQIEESERLLVIPDGPLYYLPFAALVHPDGTHLVERTPIHTAVSATVYALLQKKRRPYKPSGPEPPLQIAAFGNPIYPKGDGSGASRTVRSAVERGIFDGGLTPLPFTGYEVAEIGKIFPQTSIFLGADATEENVQALAADARIVHFAAHGVADPFTPLDSFIALTIHEDPGDRENGLLQAWEIFERVRLDADLVVLSACQTAIGPERDGEGLISLSRAFQVAGARSVLASLWKVDDRSTSELMIRFYKHLRDGLAKDEALRQAQLEFIRGPIIVDGEEMDYSPPYHWAAFQLIGDWQ